MQFKVCAFLFVLATWVGNVGGQDLLIQGTTSAFVDRRGGIKLQPEQVHYANLRDVNVQAFRRQKLNAVRSNEDGRYALTHITRGQPIIVYYDGGNNLVPELQQLAADPDRPQEIHVTLLTVDQYREIYGQDALVDHMRRIFRLLEKMDGFDLRELYERMQRFDVNPNRR